MLSRVASVALAALAVLPSFSNAAPVDQFNKLGKRDLKFPYGDEKVRGVNLGGWFVLEPWITPSIFDEWATSGQVVDELTYCATLGADEAYRRLNDHWNSWITQEDFGAIAGAGMNHVRIPIGWWSVTKGDSSPYVKGAYEKLGEALDWANSAGLKVMIDLHGAPGSQNGFDNSGKYGSVGLGQGDTVSQTLDVLNIIRDDHAGHPAVASIQLLNEPLGPALDMNVVRQFYMDGWGNLKDSNVAISFHDAFQGVNNWNDWGSGMWSLLEDTHHYEVFDNGQLNSDVNGHVGQACGFGTLMGQSNKWVISGEWTGAMTDCAKWLNGLGKGARYDGTFSNPTPFGSCDGKYMGSVAALSDTDKTNTRRFIEAQLDAYERQGDGWIFWTWKTESAPEWHMQDLLANGVFPQPLDSRQFPGQCGY